MKYVYLWSCASVVEPCNDVYNVHDMIDITKLQLNQFFLHPSFLNRQQMERLEMKCIEVD